MTVLALGAILASGCGSQENGTEHAEPTDFTGQMAVAKKGNAAVEYNVAVTYQSGNVGTRDERAADEWMA